MGTVKKTAKKRAPAKKVVTGRPTKYKQEYEREATNYCLLGGTDIQLANYFGVSEKTLNNWKNAHPDFLQAIKEGRELADANVGQSLYQRAMGFEHVTKSMNLDKEGNLVEIEKKQYIPPDTTAAIFWLKNRRKDDWRDQKQLAVEGHVTHDHRVVAVSELNQIFAEAIEHSDSDPGSDGERQGDRPVLEHGPVTSEDGPVLPAEVPAESAGRGAPMVAIPLPRRTGKS